MKRGKKKLIGLKKKAVESIAPNIGFCQWIGGKRRTNTRYWHRYKATSIISTIKFRWRLRNKVHKQGIPNTLLLKSRTEKKVQLVASKNYFFKKNHTQSTTARTEIAWATTRIFENSFFVSKKKIIKKKIFGILGKERKYEKGVIGLKKVVHSAKYWFLPVNRGERRTHMTHGTDTVIKLLV